MRQIIAMGGGGFSMEPDNPALDRYILQQTGKSQPAVCFLPTASGDADGYVVNFYAAFTKLDCRPDAKAYAVGMDAGRVKERPFESVYLASKGL
jgi:peptidase E